MKIILQLEEAAMALAAIYFLSNHTLGIAGWLWFFLFFSPDIGMLGYVINKKVGAVSYNIFHHKGVALLVGCAGYFTNNEVLLSVGILLFAHASFDRVFGYGLKYFEGFKSTHLGSLQKA